MTAAKVGKRNTREQTDMSQRTRSRASSANNDADGDNGGATVATAEAPERETREPRDGKNEGFHNLADLKEMSISKLTQIAKSMDVPGATGMRKQELIFKVLAAQTEKSLDLFGRCAGNVTGWIRLSPRAGVQLPAGSGRHLRFPIADSQV